MVSMRKGALSIAVTVGFVAACGADRPLSSGLQATTTKGPATSSGGTGGSAGAPTGGAGSTVSPKGGGGSTVSPTGGVARVEVFMGTFSQPRGLAVADAQTAWVTDHDHALVRLNLGAHDSTTVAWSDPKETIVFPPSGVLSLAGQIYATQGCSFQKFTPETAHVDFLQGGGPGGCGPSGVAAGLYGLATDGTTLYWGYPDNIDTAIFSHELATIETSTDYAILAGNIVYQGEGASDGVAGDVKMSAPRGLALDGAGSLYFADEMNHAIRRIDVSNGDTKTLAGALGQPGADDGSREIARFRAPQGLALDGQGALYVADHDNGLVRRVSLSDWSVSTVVGEAGVFDVRAGVQPTPVGHPTGIALTPAGDLIVSADVEGAVLLVHLP
jgi:streptogramin lyase